MRAGGYFFKKSDKAERSVALYYRMQRGLLSYDGCSVLELRKFVEGRGIVVDLRKAKKDNLVKALEAADDAATFDKLMDLPAELRVAICEFHFESFPALPLSPHQPPLLLASSHIRRETLPVFYSSSTFQTVVYRSSKTTSDDVQVDSEEIRATLAEESVPKPRLSLDRILEKNVTSRTKRFMTHTPAAHLSQIKRLSLQTFYHGWWEIDISKRRNDQMVSCFVEAAQPLNGPSERNKGEMSKIEAVLKSRCPTGLEDADEVGHCSGCRAASVRI